MKTSILALASILLLLPLGAFASTDVINFEAQLSVSFQAVPGQVVLAGDQVLFWTDSAAYPSFYISRDEIARANLATGILTVQTTNPLRIQDGSRSRFDFRLSANADTTAIERWFAGIRTVPADVSQSDLPKPNVSVDAAGPVEYSYSAKHKKFWGDSRGKLMFTANTIVWESLDDATESRTWSYEQVRSLDRKNPYELQVKFFNEGEFSFELQNNPVSESAFSWITNQLAETRSSARDR